MRDSMQMEVLCMAQWRSGSTAGVEVMGERVTLDLPNELARNAREVAERTNYRVEEALSERLGRAFTEIPIEGPSDEQVLVLADAQMSDEQQAELSDLVARQREESLDNPDRARLDELMSVYRRGILRKAQALQVAIAPGQPAALLYDHSDAQACSRWLLRALDVGSGYAAAVAVEGRRLYGATRSWRIVLRLPMLSVALTLEALVGVGVGWFQGEGSLIGRIHTTLVLLALLGFVWQLKYWNLLGFRRRF
jgi:hypothetical protein